jgi:hypothetical protein
LADNTPRREVLFKEEVRRCVGNGWYPGPTVLTGRRDLNSNEIRWRRAVLTELGWTYQAQGRHHWIPPEGSPLILEYRKDNTAMYVNKPKTYNNRRGIDVG